MPDKEEILQSLLDSAEDQAKRILLDTNEQLVTTFVLYNPHDKMEIFACPFHNDMEKKIMLLMLRKHMREQQTIAYSHLSEAWVAKQSHPYSDNDPRPSERPDRKEVVMAFATDGVNTKAKMWDIIRYEDGRVQRLDARNTPNDITGTMTMLLGGTA